MAGSSHQPVVKVFAQQAHRIFFSKIMENYKILNPEKVPSWLSPADTSGFVARPMTKGLGISARINSFGTFSEAFTRNQTFEFWGTNIAICTRIGEDPRMVKCKL